MFGSIGGAFTSAVGSVGNAIGDAAGSVGGAIGSGASAVGSAIGDAAGFVGGIYGDVYGTVADAVGDYGSWLLENPDTALAVGTGLATGGFSTAALGAAGSIGSSFWSPPEGAEEGVITGFPGQMPPSGFPGGGSGSQNNQPSSAGNGNFVPVAVALALLGGGYYVLR